MDPLDALDGEETLRTPSGEESSAMVTRVPLAAGDGLPRVSPAGESDLPRPVSAPSPPVPIDARASPSATTMRLSTSPSTGDEPPARESHRRAQRWAAIALLLAPLLSVIAAVVAVRALLGRTNTVERRIVELRTTTVGPEAGLTVEGPADAPGPVWLLYPFPSPPD